MTTTTQTAFSYQKQNFKNHGIEDVPTDEDAPRRIAASSYAASFDALMIVSGINSKLREGLHILLNKTRGCPFDKAVEFSDLSAGTLLSKEDEEVTEDAIKKRWKRFCDRFEIEQARLNKRILYRTPGKPIYERKAIIGFQSSSYQSHLAQMVVDVAKKAREMRNRKLSRDERFRLAAIEVWNLLPSYDEPAQSKKLPSEKRSSKEPTVSKLTTKIFKDADRLITVLKKKDLATFNHARVQILSELEARFSDGESQLEEAENGEGGDKIVTTSSQNAKKIVQNTEENCNFSESLSGQICTPESDITPSEIPPELWAIGVIDWRDEGRSGRMV